MFKILCCGANGKVISMTFVSNAVVLCLGIVIWYIYSEPELTPVIQILDGAVQGCVQYSRDGREYWAFLGIQYGAPPVDDLMFQPPVPVEPWGAAVKQVTKFPPACAQFDAFMTADTKGQLDCLYLNVFVGRGNTSGREITDRSKPVMIYIHGGGFKSGSPDMFQPEFFMDHDIVLVVMNYRLGPYGFLNLQESLDDPPSKDTPKGNMALMDQLLVLRWIQNNIGQFGGDRNKVTLMGQSAGSIMTHLHILSPKSRGLFHRAILQSGSSLSPWGFSKRPKRIAQLYAEKLGCSANNTATLLQCYNGTDWEQVVKHQVTLLEPLEEKCIFEPSVDGTFLSQLPREILQSGDIPKIPTMWGLNSGEGGIRTGRFDIIPESIPQLDEHWGDLLSNAMILDHPLPPLVSQTIREQYFSKITNFSANAKLFKENLTLMMSDAGFFSPAHRSALYHAKTGAPTYIYFYNYTSPIFPSTYNIYKAFTLDQWGSKSIKVLWTMITDMINEQIFGNEGAHVYGVSHAEDMFQWWNIYGFTKWFSGPDTDFSRAAVKALVDFANFTDTLTFRQTVWPSITEHKLSSTEDQYALPCMMLDNSEEPRVVQEPYGDRIKFWEQYAELGS